MIALKEDARGCLLPVRAQPGARKNAVVGEHAGSLKVAVTAPPQDGRANKALISVLSEALGLKRSQLSLVGGDSSRDKKFLVHGVTATDLMTRLQRWLPE